MPDPVSIAILAKAPIAGYAKTRLIPLLGAHGAAALQEALTERTLQTASKSALGAITLWAAPDTTHTSFRDLARRFDITLATQPAADLGQRMLAACEASRGPVLVIGTDCPALTPEHLRACAKALNEGYEVVTIPAEDGGYVLIGMSRPQPALFRGMVWGTPDVMAQTRARIAALHLRAHELPPLWDLDRPQDMEHLRGIADFAAFF